MPHPSEFTEDPSLSVICHECGNIWSKHVATVCPECFSWPLSRMQYDGTNCISILQFSGSPHWDNLELHGTDKPYVYVNGEPVLLEKYDWVVRGLCL